MHKARILTAFLVLTAAILACASPFDVLPTSPPANVETIVALTFAALTSPAPTVSAASSTPSLLPHSLYFLNNDGAGLLQVFRLAADGITLTQFTFEPSRVESFDVSPMDGSVAYVSNNQLLLINADGSGRRLLVDGGPVDENNPFLTSVSNPAWSPNGQTIAFGQGGINLYAVATGVSNRVIENLVDNANGFPFPTELYWPDRYSPDGAKLLVTLGYFEGGSFAVYYPAGSALVRISGAEDVICCSANWTADGSAFFTARATYGMWGPGLWRIDAATGAVTTLLSGIRLADGSFNLAEMPYLGPDGQLYYFFGNLNPGDDFINRAPLQLVRSAPDAVTGRVILRPETYNLLNEALWAPDASFVIAASAPIDTVYQGGRAELIYTDGRPAVVVASYAYQMKWGP